jgi:hypothetical protein
MVTSAVRAVLRAEVLFGAGFVAGCLLSGLARGIYMGIFGIHGC